MKLLRISALASAIAGAFFSSPASAYCGQPLVYRERMTYTDCERAYQVRAPQYRPRHVRVPRYRSQHVHASRHSLRPPSWTMPQNRPLLQSYRPLTYVTTKRLCISAAKWAEIASRSNPSDRCWHASNSQGRSSANFFSQCGDISGNPGDVYSYFERDMAGSVVRKNIVRF